MSDTKTIQLPGEENTRSLPQKAPPGYRNAMEKRQGERDIVPVDGQFVLVRKLFEEYLTEKYSVQSLCRYAEEIGVKNTRGNPISKTQLYKVLSDPFYTGVRYVYK